MRHTQTLFIICLLFFTSCREDVEETIVDITPDPPIVTIGNGDIQFRGRILNEIGVPLEDVLVANYGETALSDQNGYYTIPTAQTQPDGAAFVTISKDGYFDEYRQTYPTSASINMLDVVLQSNLSDDIINGETGGTFETPEGVRLIIPAGAAMSNGQAFSGDIRIKIVYEDPTSYTDIEQSAANVPGWRNSELVELATYGMAKVSMETVRGDRISFSAGQPATLEMPLPESLSGYNDTMFFWQLQEQVWVSLGQAENSNGFLSANITGSGDYNYDIPFPRATICGTLVDQDGMKLRDQSFAIVVDNGAFVFTARTNEKGHFCIQVPRDQVLQIRIPDPCAPDESLYEATLGPFPEGPTQIGEITVDITLVQKPVSITDCEDGSPFTIDKGLLWINGFGFGYPAGTNSAGLANVQLPNCDGNGETFQVQAVANDERRTSSLALVTSEDLTTLELEVCSEPEEEEFFEFNISNAGTYQANEVSYLLRQRQFGPLSHQLWGRSISGTDTTEMLIYLLDLAPGDYTLNPDIFRNEDGVRSYHSTCLSCPGGNRLTIDEVGPDQSFINGTFQLQVSQRDSETRALIESGVIVSGSFHINR